MELTRQKTILSPRDVAEYFGVTAKTVTRWAETGRLPFFRTPGGHRRFRLHDVMRFVDTHGERIYETDEEATWD